MAAWAAPPQNGLQIEVSVTDQSKLAVPALRLELQSPGAVVARDTDENGRAVFTGLSPAKYRLRLHQNGFEAIDREVDLSGGASISLQLDRKSVV